MGPRIRSGRDCPVGVSSLGRGTDAVREGSERVPGGGDLGSRFGTQDAVLDEAAEGGATRRPARVVLLSGRRAPLRGCRGRPLTVAPRPCRSPVASLSLRSTWGWRPVHATVPQTVRGPSLGRGGTQPVSRVPVLVIPYFTFTEGGWAPEDNITSSSLRVGPWRGTVDDRRRGCPVPRTPAPEPPTYVGA